MINFLTFQAHLTTFGRNKGQRSNDIGKYKEESVSIFSALVRNTALRLNFVTLLNNSNDKEMAKEAKKGLKRSKVRCLDIHSFNPPHLNIDIHIPLTFLFPFHMALTRRILLTIRSFWNW